MKRITKVTKRDIYELFRDGIDTGIFETKFEVYPYYGRLTELTFLERLYRLTEMPSQDDDRYYSAKDDIYQHTVNNDDYPSCWVFNDERFPLKNGTDEEYLRFICEVFHPEVCIKGDLCQLLYHKINVLLKNDRYELYEIGTISGHSLYDWRELTDEEAVAEKLIPFSIRYKPALERKALKLSISRAIRKNIIAAMDRYEVEEELVTETNWHYSQPTKMAVWDDLQTYYKPYCFNESKIYTEASDLNKFLLNNYPEKVFDAVELFASYPPKKKFVREINMLLKNLGWQLFDGKIMHMDRLSIMAEEPQRDTNLKELISQAEAYFRSNERSSKQMAIEKIWDAFERVKTYYSSDKKKSMAQIISHISNGNEDISKRIDGEFRELTQIGNTYQIRHFEKEKIAISDDLFKEYLYYRCLALINLTIKTLKEERTY